MKLKSKHKITGLALLAALLPALVMSILFTVQKGQVTSKVSDELDVLGRRNIAQIAQDAYALCETANDMTQQQVDRSLNVARDILTQSGQVELSSETVSWEAINQFSKESTSIALPKMTVGGVWLGQNRNMAETTPVVDEVVRLVGGDGAIFQRMNERGDMLRVATSVEALDHTRAIGTYIPAINPDGEPNAVISTVLRGEAYRGRAYAVNAWYITAYEPIRDKERKIIGILAVGIKQEEMLGGVRQAIMQARVGETGYVWVVGGTGDDQGHYIISKGGQRDGEDIWEAQDADGNLFVQSMVSKALAAWEGEVSYERYPWQNPGEPEARMKISAVTYFGPWDWVIGAGVYEDELFRVRNTVESGLSSLLSWALVGGLIALGIVAVLAFFVGGEIAKSGRD